MMRKIADCALTGIASLVMLTIPFVARSAAAPNSWPAETVSGKIMMVETASKIVVVDYSNNVPLDLVVTPQTRIEVGRHAVPFKDLAQYVNQPVSVRFVPEGRGDIAKSIEIGG